MNKKIYIIIIPFLLTFILIGLVNAANNGSIGGLFFAYPGEFGYNWNGQTFTKSKYTLDGRNIHTDFGGKTLTTTGSINAGTGTFSNKVTSKSTFSSDPNNTLTTKDYVINEVNKVTKTCPSGQILTSISKTNSTCIVNNLGNHIATTTLNMNGNSISKIGTMYDASNRVTRDAGGGWIRTYGTTGWYNGSFGGGWYMSDSTWLRSYLNKSIYTGGNLLLGGKAYSAATSVWDSANTLTTKDYVDSKLTNNSTYPIFYSKTTGKYWDGKKICKTFLSTATYGSIDGASWGGGILNNLVGLNLGYASLSGWGLNVKNTGSYNLTYCLRNRNNTIQTKLSYPAFTYTSKNKPGNKLNVSVPAKNTGWVNGQAKLGLYIKQNCSGCGKNYLNLGTSSTNDSPVRITSAVFGSISLF